MRWFWLIAGLGVAYLVASNLVSPVVMGSLTARPFDLVRGDERVPVWLPQTVTETQPEGTARMTIGTGAFLGGVRMGYALPGGAETSCSHTIFGVRCRDGWRAEFEEVEADY